MEAGERKAVGDEYAGADAGGGEEGGGLDKWVQTDEYAVEGDVVAGYGVLAGWRAVVRPEAEEDYVAGAADQGQGGGDLIADGIDDDVGAVREGGAQLLKGDDWGAGGRGLGAGVYGGDAGEGGAEFQA